MAPLSCWICGARDKDRCTLVKYKSGKNKGQPVPIGSHKNLLERLEADPGWLPRWCPVVGAPYKDNIAPLAPLKQEESCQD